MCLKVNLPGDKQSNDETEEHSHGDRRGDDVHCVVCKYNSHSECLDVVLQTKALNHCQLANQTEVPQISTCYCKSIFLIIIIVFLVHINLVFTMIYFKLAVRCYCCCYVCMCVCTRV